MNIPYLASSVNFSGRVEEEQNHRPDGADLSFVET